MLPQAISSVRMGYFAAWQVCMALVPVLSRIGSWVESEAYVLAEKKGKCRAFSQEKEFWLEVVPCVRWGS